MGAMSIMEVYTTRTHGSYIEETEMKVLWQYRDADLEFGYVQARELEDVSECDTNVSADMECFTCTIGKKPSAAASYLQDVDEVEELLNALVKVSKNPNASKSMLDLMMMSAEAEATMNVTNPQGFGVAASNTLLTKAPPRGPPRVSATIGDYFDGMDDDEEEDMFF